MNTLLRRVAVVMLLGTLTVPARADLNAFTDDKSVSVPTGWSTYADRTPAQINALLASNQARLTDIEPHDSAGTRYTVTMVRNSGAYAAPGWAWQINLTVVQISLLLNQTNSRLIDIEPYSTSAGTRFAVITVPNTGPTARVWTWVPGATAAQVDLHVALTGHRLTHLKQYQDGTLRRYVILTVANTGADAKAWQYFYNQSANDVATKMQAFIGRIASLEKRQDSGTSGENRYDVVLYRNDGADGHYGRFYFSLTSLDTAVQYAAQFASRIVDVETYVSNGARRYNVVLIDNANDENRRVRGLFGETLVSRSNGHPNGQWGAYLKPLGGSASVSLNGSRRFEPASAIKAVHNAAMMIRRKNGLNSVEDRLTYYNYPSDGLDGQGPEACPDPDDEHAGNAKKASFGQIQLGMMAQSDNRFTRTVTLLYGDNVASQAAKGISGIAALENLAFNSLGMTDTFMDQDLIGCAYANGKRNQTTLADLGRLYERVENGSVLGVGTHRESFYRPMNGGKFTDGSEVSMRMRAIVNQEAAAQGKSGDSFNAAMEWRHKGGSYTIFCENASFTPCTEGFISISTMAGRLTVPRRVNGQIVERDYVFGSYSSDLNACDDMGTPCSICPNCTNVDDRDEVLQKVQLELFRTVIRENLATF